MLKIGDVTSDRSKFMIAKFPRIDFKHPISNLENWRDSSGGGVEVYEPNGPSPIPGSSSNSSSSSNSRKIETSTKLIRDTSKLDHNRIIKDGLQDKLPGLVLEEKYRDQISTGGKGSEFGKRSRDKTNAIKKGFNNSRSYDVDELPFELSINYHDSKKLKTSNNGYEALQNSNNRNAKPPANSNTKFIGTRERVNETSMYFVFMLTADDKSSLLATPIDASYIFKPKPTYKTLDADEAEDHWENRDKIMDQSAFMKKFIRMKEEKEKMEADLQDREGAAAHLKIMDSQNLESSDDDEKPSARRKNRNQDDSSSDEEEQKMYRKLAKKHKKADLKAAKAKKMHGNRNANEFDDGMTELGARDELEDGDDEGDEIDYDDDHVSSDFEEEEEQKELEVLGDRANILVNTNEDEKQGAKNLLDDLSSDDSDVSEDEHAPSSDDEEDILSESGKNSNLDDDEEMTISISGQGALGQTINGIPIELLDDDADSSNPGSVLPPGSEQDESSRQGFGTSDRDTPNSMLNATQQTTNSNNSGKRSLTSPTNELMAKKIRLDSSAQNSGNQNSNSRANTPTDFSKENTISVDQLKKYLKRPTGAKKLFKQMKKLYSGLTKEQIMEDITAGLKQLDQRGLLDTSTSLDSKSEKLYKLRS